MQRRDFLCGSAAMGLVASLPAPAASGEAVDFDIIDCHTHFYDPQRPEGVPWPGKNSPLYRTVLPADLRSQPMFRPVTGTVIVEASPWVEDNQWLLDLAARDPFIVGIVGNLEPGQPEFAGHLARFAANPLFRGIRVNVKRVQTLLERNELQDFQRLAERDMALDVNGGPETPAVIAQLAARLSKLRIVLNHIGNVRITREAPPTEWVNGIRAAAACPNVYSKISALVEGAARDGQTAPTELDFYRPYLDVVWNAFGDDRVIYGSNWPVSDRAADYKTLQTLALAYAFEKGETATRKFCAGNAARAYIWQERLGRRG